MNTKHSMFKSESSFLVLYTTDIQKTQKFFKLLSVPITESGADKVVVTFGGFELHYILNTSEPFSDYLYIAEAKNYGQGAIFYIETENLEDTRNLIEQAGGTIISDIFDNKWNCKELLIEDPNGYKFAFYQ